MAKKTPTVRAKDHVAPQIPELERPALVRPLGGGTPVWHDLQPTRFACPIPPAQGPIRAREHRASLDPRARAMDAFGTTQVRRDRDVPKN